MRSNSIPSCVKCLRLPAKRYVKTRDGCFTVLLFHVPRGTRKRVCIFTAAKSVVKVNAPRLRDYAALQLEGTPVRRTRVSAHKRASRLINREN